MPRTLARRSAHVSSIVGEELYPVAVTAIPSSFAASISIEGLREPVDAISFSLGRRFKNLSRNGVRSRITQTMSKRQEPLDKSGWICNVVVKDSDLCRSEGPTNLSFLIQHFDNHPGSRSSSAHQFILRVCVARRARQNGLSFLWHALNSKAHLDCPNQGRASAFGRIVPARSSSARQGARNRGYISAFHRDFRVVIIPDALVPGDDCARLKRLHLIEAAIHSWRFWWSGDSDRCR